MQGQGETRMKKALHGKLEHSYGPLAGQCGRTSFNDAKQSVEITCQALPYNPSDLASKEA